MKARLGDAGSRGRRRARRVVLRRRRDRRLAWSSRIGRDTSPARTASRSRRSPTTGMLLKSAAELAAIFHEGGRQAERHGRRLLPHRPAGDGDAVRRAHARPSGAAVRRIVRGLVAPRRLSGRESVGESGQVSDAAPATPIRTSPASASASCCSRRSSSPAAGSARRARSPAARRASWRRHRPRAPRQSVLRALPRRRRTVARLAALRDRRRDHRRIPLRALRRTAARDVERGPRHRAAARDSASAFGGGAVMGLGAVLARGCTSGQALTGGALLSVGSWLFMIAAFAAAYLFAPFVKRAWR